MIKILEGTAAHIEEEGNKILGYDLESIRFTNRSKIYTDDECTTVSNKEYNFYVAIFKPRRWD